MSFRLAATASLLLLSSCVPTERPGDASPSARPQVARPTAAELMVTGEEAGVGGEDEGAALAALPVLTSTFRDDFERRAIGDDYLATGSRQGQYRIEGGELCVRGARNHPLWLRHRLPVNARIEVEARTTSPDGDIKLEAWGDGQAPATRIAYANATSYRHPRRLDPI